MPSIRNARDWDSATTRPAAQPVILLYFILFFSDHRGDHTAAGPAAPSSPCATRPIHRGGDTVKGARCFLLQYPRCVVARVYHVLYAIYYLVYVFLLLFFFARLESPSTTFFLLSFRQYAIVLRRTHAAFV